MNSISPSISVKKLDYWFGEGEAKKQALFDINLDIQPGDLTILMGPSGSGKTTLLTLMACLRTLQTGSVNLLGQELFGIDEEHQISIRRKLGFIFQAHNLHESLTALENVLMGLQVHGAGNREKQRKAAIHALSSLGLEERVDYLINNLSGGQKQRVAIARAMVANPQVIFADEPTAALDKESGRQVVEILKTLGEHRNTTTLMVTHDNRILDFADRIITMEDGRIVSDEYA
ncbi:ATP-binding cassette domain-containing protein [Glaciecola sp. MF2-115]|uniref:ATP-binding cassette domain-containing protein n=1 Tax=Glaciecola sp. MF2-115 TaxID=3384827 RepID=UPI0039A39C45